MRRLVWQMYFAVLAVALGGLLVVGFYSARSIGALYRDSLSGELQARARMLARMVEPELTSGSWRGVHRICREIGEQTGTRLTVVLPDGSVVGDTLEDPANMERHHTRPEIGAALAGRMGAQERYSATMGERFSYVAAPVLSNGKVIGAARASFTLADISKRQALLRRQLIAGGLAAAILAMVAAFGLSKRITLPVERMRRVAEKYSEGDFDVRMPVEGPIEMAMLAKVVNSMGERLNDRIAAVTEQRNEREAILSSMTEGVFTVDASERVCEMNAAAAGMLHTTQEAVKGRHTTEVLRSTRLQELVAGAVRNGRAGECDLLFRIPDETFVQTRAVPIAPLEGKVAGAAAMVVMTDVTRLKRLEAVRRDFVANVSHELKTPITSIRAACETLRDGSAHNEETERRFLDIIHRHIGRLEAIVEDLLSLAWIENRSEREDVQRTVTALRPVLESALDACRSRAAERNTELSLELEDEPAAAINGALIEQAVINLLDNAVKFSPPGAEVKLECRSEGKMLYIAIKDRGPGIRAEHLDRIFERFYCVDPGRSRTLGGTGLGLAIVKHVVLLHSGEVHVESEPGRGSTFIIELPFA